jgi:archaellum component FlaC
MINYITQENKFYINTTSNNQQLKEINLLFNKIHQKFTNFDYQIDRKKSIKAINNEIKEMLYKIEDLTDYFEILQKGILEINQGVNNRQL